MMKKFIPILIGLLLAHLLAACSNNGIAPAIMATTSPPDRSTPELAGSPASGPVEMVLSITGDPNRLSSPNDLEVDRQGNLYVVDSLDNRIQKFDRNGQFLTMWGTRGKGDGEFNLIVPDVGAGAGAVAVGESGNVYVADWGNHRIQKFDSNGQFLAKWGTLGRGDGQFFNLVGVAVDREGHVYVLDDGHTNIQKFDSNGQFLARWGSRGTGDGEFLSPASLTVGGQSTVYILDGFNNRIQKFDGEGQFLTKWGTSGKGDGQFSFIAGEYGIGLGGVAVDEQGNIYVADYGNNRIQKFDDKGRFLTQWGTGGIGDDQLNHPIALTVDGEGNVYVLDYGNNRIQKFRQK